METNLLIYGIDNLACCSWFKINSVVIHNNAVSRQKTSHYDKMWENNMQRKITVHLGTVHAPVIGVGYNEEYKSTLLVYNWMKEIH